MYKLTFDGQPVYDPRGANDTDNLIIVEPAVTLAVNAAGSVSFSVYPQHPMAGKITRLRGTLELADDDGVIFRGRILPNDETTFYGAIKYTAEGALAYLNDCIVEPYAFPADFTTLPGYQTAADPSGNLVAWWLAWLLDKYNASAPADRQIKLGTVTVRDPNNYITAENSNYSSTWETIRDKFVGKMGGYLLMRYEDDGNYLDYLAELPRTNPQRVTFAENLLDILIKAAGDNLFTAILPVGADGLTLAGLPDGPLEGGLIKDGKLIIDPAAEAEYGSRIARVVTWDDVTMAKNLQTKAAAELSASVRLPESISVKACDLHGVDGVTPHFRVGQYVRVESAPHGIDEAYPLLEMSPDILNPGATVISLNSTRARFTAQVWQSQVAADDRMRTAVSDMSRRLTEQINNASGLYPTEQPQPDGSTIWLLHDKPTLEESSIVISVSSAGIGLSTDGGSTYPYGYTVTGKMVMDYVAANGIECSWLKAGSLNLGILSLAGTLCGLMQGYGRTGDGRTTRGICIFGNGKNTDGTAKPPYMIVTSDGVRIQVSDSSNVVFSNGYMNVHSLQLDSDSTISADKGFGLGGNISLARYDSNNNYVEISANKQRTFMRGKQVYINEDHGDADEGWNSETYIRGMSIYATRSIQVTSDEREKKDITPLPAAYLALLDGMEPVLYRYRTEADDAPLHMGYTAQAVRRALESAGLTRADLAALGAYTTPEGEERMGIAYEEIIALLHLKIKAMETKIDQYIGGIHDENH